MARMIPWPFPAEEDADPGRDAEKLIYRLFDEKLPEQCSVIYSVSWLSKDRSGRAQQGEVDFCLLDDERGLVLLEVKGGGISRDAASGKWTSQDRYGKTHSIKNPALQVQRSMYALLDKLNSLPTWGNQSVRLGYAVAFPNVRKDADVQLPPDMPRSIVILGADLDDLDQKIEEIFEFWQRESDDLSRPDPAVLEKVLDLLSPTFELRTTLGHQIRSDAEKVLELTPQQIKTFNAFRGNSRVAMRGVAGSGKTVIALEQARRLASEGFRTLLTCYNRPLADTLIEQTRGDDLIVCNSFHGFCEQMAVKAGVVLPSYPDNNAPPSYFDEDLPIALAESLDRLPDERFDAVIVDEGQDFHPDWLALLELSQRAAREGVFFLFYDESQQIYTREFQLPADMVSVVLARNLRTTRTIHEAALKMCPAAGEAGGPDGRDVEFIAAEDPKAVRRELSRVLHRLVREEDVRPEDIAILSGRSVGGSSLAGVNEVGAFRLTGLAEMAEMAERGDGAGKSTGAILRESIYRFKGLERPVVILIDIESKLEKNPGLIYVGITRALSHLIVIDREEVRERLGGGSQDTPSAD